MTDKQPQRKIISITNDGFPFETFPRQGTITIHYDDGSLETCAGTPIDEALLKEKNGLAPPGGAAELRRKCCKVFKILSQLTETERQKLGQN